MVKADKCLSVGEGDQSQQSDAGGKKRKNEGVAKVGEGDQSQRSDAEGKKRKDEGGMGKNIGGRSPHQVTHSLRSYHVISRSCSTGNSV